jgi:hypothetical protein
VAVLFLLGVAHGQQVDAAFGITTVISPTNVSSTGDHSPQTIGGGAYPTVSGDVLLRHAFGVEGEVSWRAAQNDYFGFQPYRPLFYDVNAIWAPAAGRRAGLELLGGIGAESVRFYTGQTLCNFTSCTNYTSSNHFLADVGAGVKLYVTKHIFVRPEVREYFIHNNVEFTSPYATRVGASVGYTFGTE